MQNIKAIEQSDAVKFESEINRLLQEDYKILSASCSSVNNTYHAILIKSGR